MHEMDFCETHVLMTPDGAALNVRRQIGTAHPKAIVQISHGFAEHSARYGHFARFLGENGYIAFAHDHRGHGLTRAPDAPLGRFALRDGNRQVVTDVISVRNQIAKEYPAIPVILFGHSMGGMIAINAAEDNPNAYSGLAVWNSKLNPGVNGALGLLLLKAERFFKGSDVPSQLGPRLTFELWNSEIGEARTAFDWLSHDQETVDAYIADPLCGFDASVSMWIDVVKLATDSAREARLNRLPSSLPIYLVGGGQDPSTDYGRDMRWLEKRLKASGKTRVLLTVFEKMRHETLNETGRMGAMKTFLTWADSIVAP